MAGLGLAIHDLRAVGRAARRSRAYGIEDTPGLKRRESGPAKAWMAGPSPAMTVASAPLLPVCLGAPARASAENGA